jgi:LAO/AO transport system kinase
MESEAIQAEKWFEGIVRGDRIQLGKALSLVESDRDDDRKMAVLLLEKCDAHVRSRKRSCRFAISGAPGVGKSTLLETLGIHIVEMGRTIGVLTIDPTSAMSQGSILGDKSRMSKLAVSSKAFIRSSAAGQVLGGMARRSMEMMLLLETAGYDIIFLETVGVGQSEHMAWQFTDGFILVIQPGGGDELQGMKRGITELTDILVINKADGALAPLARMAKAQFETALHYFSPLRSNWEAKVVTCSAIEGTGIPDLYQTIQSFEENLNAGDIVITRNRQQNMWLHWSLELLAKKLVMQHPVITQKLETVKAKLQESNGSPFRAEYEIEHLMKSLIFPPDDSKNK